MQLQDTAEIFDGYIKNKQAYIDASSCFLVCVNRSS